MARPGSTHGYDTVDHTRINPELGTLDEFRKMAKALRDEGLGIILDIVPNHVGIGGAENHYWLDVLEHGEASRYAAWFDIDWHPPEPGLDGRILVPFLDRPYGEALSDGLFELRMDTIDRKVAVWLPGGHKLPLSPETCSLTAEEVRSLNSPSRRADLDALLTRQHWLPAKFTAANDEINYRRFFINSDLAGIRIELPEVFDHVHRLVFQLIDEGWVEGLRIDHIDGLFDPEAYCRRLRAKAPRPIYLVVEKILAEGEQLPRGWGVDGTTGYEFAAIATPLIVDPGGRDELTKFDSEIRRGYGDPTAIEWRSKQRVMSRELAAELEALSHRFAVLAGSRPATRDLPRLAIKRGLSAFVAAMPVYRTYVVRDGVSPADRKAIETALQTARQRETSEAQDALDFIEAVMLDPAESGDRDAAVALAARLQQFTGPVMAKGLEDTALYRFNRLIALNDVGERPDRFSASIAEFHAANIERTRSHPHSMLASSTHDSKRGEDTRARIAALSGHASGWIEAVSKWMEMLRQRGAPAIAADDAHVFFQTLLGAWPGEKSSALADRIWGAMQKALREARLRSDWGTPDVHYEEAVERYVRLALDEGQPNRFIDAFMAFEEQVGWHGALNGLVGTTLKLTVPGVPDIYQGAELWEQSLVDPDNRRPVDFALRADLLRQATLWAPLAIAHDWRRGAIKQSLITGLLHFRRSHTELFDKGTYDPVQSEELERSNVCAFTRRHGDDQLFVAVRLFPWRRRTDDTSGPYLAPVDDTLWMNVLTGQKTLRPALEPELPIAVFSNLRVETSVATTTQ